MITPPSTDLEITWRISFAPKTLATKQSDRGVVVRLNVSLEPVKPQLPESASNYEAQPFAYIAFSRMRD
jgi:hypothetical protein